MTETWAGSLWAIWDGSTFRVHGLKKGAALAAASGREYLVPEAYVRGPRHTEADALARAVEDLNQSIAAARVEAGQDLTFESRVTVDDRTPMWWVFRQFCVEWQDAGRIPGAVSCLVDKVDLHIWTHDEVERFWRTTGRVD